jgi:hypothetical protein
VLRRPIRAALLAAGLALLALLGCPGGRRGPPPERFVPAAARVALVVPAAGRAAEELADLHASVAGFPGAGELAGARGALAAQLGFDPLDPEALADAGIDPRRGAAVALLDRARPRGEGGSAALVVLPASDAPRIERLLARIARDRLGATERVAETQGGVAAVVFRRPGSPVAALTYAVVDRTTLLTTHPAGPALVAEAAALDPAASLAEAPGWKLARAALGDEVAAIAFAPAGSSLLAGAWALADGAAIGVSAAAGRLRARAAILLGAREASFRALAADGRAAAALARLDPEAPLAARWDGDFAALGGKLVPMIGARDRKRLAARGVDLERDLFSVLAPGGAVALSLPPQLALGALSADAARSDPLRALEFEAILPYREGTDPAAAAERLARAFGAARRGRGRGRDDGVARLTTPSGEIAWKVDADARRILAAGGRPGRLDALAARVAGEGAGWRAPTPGASAALSGGLGGAALDVGRLVAGVRALPDEAFGTGPSGFVMRSLVERVVEPASRLAAISLRADLAEGALVLDLEVEARRTQEAAR